MDDLTNDDSANIDDAERLPVAQGKLCLPLLRGVFLEICFLSQARELDVV